MSGPDSRVTTAAGVDPTATRGDGGDPTATHCDGGEAAPGTDRDPSAFARGLRPTARTTTSTQHHGH